jgi:hypothetical protein
MPANLTQTESYPTTVQGPAGGDARTATSVRSMGSPLASRTHWLKSRLDSIFGGFQLVGGVDTTSDTFTITAHGLVTGDPIYVVQVGGTLPTPLTLDQVVYVIKISDDEFQVALTPSDAAGGTEIDLTGAGSGSLYVFKVVTALDKIKHTTFNMLSGVTIPAGHLRTTISTYLLSILGGTMFGPLKFAGNSGYEVWRYGALLNQAAQSFTGTQKHHWLCPDVGQDSVYTIADGIEEGQWFIVSRRAATQAFKADFVDSGTNLISRFPASAKSGTLFAWSNQDGAGLKWHADVFWGSAIPGT